MAKRIRTLLTSCSPNSDYKGSFGPYKSPDPNGISPMKYRKCQGLLHPGWEEPIHSQSCQGGQYVYSKGRSIESAHHELVRTIESSLNFRELTVVAFQDIEDAFNNINSDVVIEVLPNLKVDNGISVMIQRSVNEQIIMVNRGTSTQTRFVNRGTPQEGFISLTVNAILLDVDR